MLTGDSPFGLLQRFRLERADQLLRQGAGNVGEVARAVGYGDPSTFSKAFRRHFEVPPSDRLGSQGEDRTVSGRQRVLWEDRGPLRQEMGYRVPLRYNPVYEERMYRPAVREYFGQKGYYNYGYWESGTLDQAEACRNLVGKMVDQLRGTRGQLLEVACGLGGTTSDLTGRFDASRVLASDLSMRNVHNARLHVPGSQGVLMDAASIAIGDERVDHILSVEAAFHFDTRESFLKESLRILRPEGRLVLSDILFRRIRSRFLPTGNHLADPAAYEGLLRRVGFREIEVVDVTEACWGGFRRNLRSWGWAAFRTTRGSAPTTLRVRRLVGLGLWLGSLRMALRHYLLVSATK